MLQAEQEIRYRKTKAPPALWPTGLRFTGKSLVLLFAGLFAIPLARQCFLDATLFTGLQVVGVTFDFLDDVFLLNLPLKPAERILKRLAFLYANLCQIEYTPCPAMWLSSEYGIFDDWAN